MGTGERIRGRGRKEGGRGCRGQENGKNDTAGKETERIRRTERIGGLREEEVQEKWKMNWTERKREKKGSRENLRERREENRKKGEGIRKRRSKEKMGNEKEKRE